MENKKMKIAEFYKKVFSDSKLKEKLEEKVKKITNEEDFKKLIREEIVPLIKRFNVNFSEEELLEYEEETLKKISKGALGNVSGGVSIKSALLAGGLLSIALLGGRVNLSANAAPPVTQNGKASATQSQKYIPFGRWFTPADTQLNHILNFIENNGIKTTTKNIKTFLGNLKNNDLESFTKLESDAKYLRDQIQGEAPLLVLKGRWSTYNISTDKLDKIMRLNSCFEEIKNANTNVENNDPIGQENDTDIKQTMSAAEELEENEYEDADNNENNLPNNIDQSVNNDVNDSNDKTNRYEIIQKNNSDNEPITSTVKKELEENTKENNNNNGFATNSLKEYSSEDNNDDDSLDDGTFKGAKKTSQENRSHKKDDDNDDYKIKGSKKDSSKKFVGDDNSKVSDAEKAKLKKAFIKKLLEHNVDLKSLYDKKSADSFDDDAIAGEINTVLGKLKENNSIAGVNWDQTNYDQGSSCIKLFLENYPTESVDITLDEIRMFNLEKIRRAWGRNRKRHLAGSWEAFKDQKFAGILSYEHSMLDPNIDMTSDEGLLVQKLNVQTPFGESELWVYYKEESNILIEKKRMVRRQRGNGEMYDMPYKGDEKKGTKGAKESFDSLVDFDKAKIINAIKEYLYTEVTKDDVTELNKGKAPLVLFNEKVIKAYSLEAEKKEENADKIQDMSDLAAILMFCENSHSRVNAGGKWERAFMEKAKEFGIDLPGYWLQTKSNTEIPEARWFSKSTVENLDWGVEGIENFVTKEYKTKTRYNFNPSVHSVNVIEKLGDLNGFNLSNSSDEENQNQDTTATEHMVESTVKIGDKDCTLSQMVKCADSINPGNLITTKYKYLNPIVLSIDGIDVHT